MENMAKYYMHEIPEGYEARIEGNKVIIELRESEDEKMINELQGFLDSFGADYFGTGEWQKFHDWLEKQKETHYTKRNALFDKCVAECDPAVMKEVSDEIDEMLRKEQKPNIEICPHSIKSKSYKENGYPIEDCDYGLEIALDILEKTLGKVQGFQTDDGIREHQTAIEAVRKAQEQKPVDDIIGRAISYFGAESLLDNANGLSNFEKFTAWLYCEFLRGLPKKLNQEYIKEQTSVILDAAQKELCKMPDSTKLIEMWDKEKANLEEKDFRGDTWRIAYNAFMDGFAKGTCVKFDRQKEQRPVETFNFKTKLAEYLQNNSPKDGQYVISAESILQMAKEELLKRGVVQKPVEWSKEDEEMRNIIIAIFEVNHPNGFFKANELGTTDMRGVHTEEIISWLKSLPINLKKKNEDVAKLCSNEWSEEDEDMRLEAIRVLVSGCERYRKESGCLPGWHKVISWLKSLHPVKQEWSKEDEENLGKLHRLLVICQGEKKFIPSDEYDKLDKWLNSLRPQPKPEWSKEETKDLVHILKVLDDCYIYGKHDLSKTDYDNLTSTLKSLRPSWKPSEEQMKALEECGECKRCIKELYEQLKSIQ